MSAKSRIGFVLFAAVLFADPGSHFARGSVPPTVENPWYAIHLINYGSDANLQRLAEQLPQLRKLGINCIILEVNYSFDFQSHPELRQTERPISKKGAQQFVASCRKNGIE